MFNVTSKTSKPFDFITTSKPSPKPRKNGIIEVRGPYYSAVTLDYLKGLLDDWGEYIDGLKFAGGSFSLLSEARLTEYIKICHNHDVFVDTGGWIERVLVDGKEVVDKYISTCKKVGFDIVEVSSGMAPEIMNMSVGDKVAIVKKISQMGMKPKPEVSIMVGAGAGTHVGGYEEAMKYRNIEDFVKETRAYLDAGAELIMVESEGITEDLPQEKWRVDVIQRLLKEFGYEKLMFESSDPPVFKWYLKNVGRDVNLFIDHSQTVEFTAWKYGLWGDKEIWKGKTIEYK
jgi:phosphosulfolactate synthase (CoM biosynthesis protein A)